MPFGYLEFSRAIGRIPCPHMRTHAPALAAAAGRPGSSPGPGLGSGSGSLPGPVLFETGLTGMDYRGSYLLRHLDPNPKAQRLSANRREQLGDHFKRRLRKFNRFFNRIVV